MTNPRSKKGSKRAPAKRAARTTTVPKQKGPAPPRVPNSPAFKHAVESICGLNDPFCEAARSAKYITAGNTRSLNYTLKYNVSVTTDVNGNGAALFCPSYFYEPVSIASSIAGGGYATFPAFTAMGLIAGVDAIRITSSGLIVRNVANAMSAQGMVHVRNWSNKDTGSILTTNLSGYTGCSASETLPLTQCTRFAAMTRRTDETAANWRRPGDINPSNAADSYICPGAEYITVAIIGGPASSSPLALEVVVNYELVFEMATGMNALATKTPAATPMLKSAFEQVSSVVKPYAVAGAEAMGRGVVTAAATALGSYFGIPPSVSYGAGRMIADRTVHSREVN